MEYNSTKATTVENVKMTHAETFEPNDKITHHQRLTRIRVSMVLLVKSSTKEENVNIITRHSPENTRGRGEIMWGLHPLKPPW